MTARMTLEELWRSATDREVLSIARKLANQTEEAQRIIREELARRDLPAPEELGRLTEEPLRATTKTPKDINEVATAIGKGIAQTPAMALAGGAGLAIGLYFLLLAPDQSGSGIANTHRLALGSTFTIVGVLLLIGQKFTSSTTVGRPAARPVGPTPSDKSTEHGSSRSASDAESDGSGGAAPGQPPMVAIEDRLRRLHLLHEKGLISEAELTQRRVEILREL